MSEVRVRENESLESALKRFKRSCAKSGVLAEVRKREHYELLVRTAKSITNQHIETPQRCTALRRSLVFEKNEKNFLFMLDK